MLLKVGRHFRLTPSARAVVGRDEAENAFLDRFLAGRWRLHALDHFGPVTLVQGLPSEQDLGAAAAITARYSDGRSAARVRVRAALFTGAGEEDAARGLVLETAPATEEALSSWRI
jgi:tRNA-uridine 2-sulfurtransferase